MGSKLAQSIVFKVLEIPPEAQKELQKVDTYEFDIFKLRETTNGNELITILPFILAKHGLIASNRLDFGKLIQFTRVLAQGYKTITYHN